MKIRVSRRYYYAAVGDDWAPDVLRVEERSLVVKRRVRADMSIAIVTVNPECVEGLRNRERSSLTRLPQLPL